MKCQCSLGLEECNCCGREPDDAGPVAPSEIAGLLAIAVGVVSLLAVLVIIYVPVPKVWG